MRTLAPARKKELFERAKNGEKPASLCREFGISRFTFYKWQRRWWRNPSLESLADRRAVGDKHWRTATAKRVEMVKEVIAGHPAWSSHQIASFLQKSLKISNHGIQGILERNRLSLKTQRQAYQERAGLALPAKKFADFSPEERLRFLLAASEKKCQIASLCRQYGLSRYTYYKWYKRWGQNQLNWQASLASRRPAGEAHWRFLPAQKQALILKLVAAHPEYSVHRLAESFRGTVGHHGIQKILSLHRLNTLGRRLAYAQTQAPAIQVQPIPWVAKLKTVWETFTPQTAPAPPPFAPAELRGDKPPVPPTKLSFAQAKWGSWLRLFFTSCFSTTLVSILFLAYVSMLSGQPFGAQIGLTFASVALVTGTFFFLYSMKYYLTIAIVLSFSAQGMKVSGEVGSSSAGKGQQPSLKGWLGKIFGLSGSQTTQVPIQLASGLTANLDHITFERYPFISIQLPFYNEKKVANRIISACASMDYPNFEVIVCDDSNDETVDIVNSWVNHPKVKVLHRPTREGFKGGALGYALKAMDPRTEFVVVFDADFVPYPDTLTQFMRYFKATGGWCENLDYKTAGITTVRYDTNRKTAFNDNEKELSEAQLASLREKNSTAVVAGYQWHVLNKSENWITRGVRTEYSGSYVIERPGQEILGAMKIIHGSVYCMRADVLKHFGWGTSITEDYELTLRIYEKGFKVVFTPYIQAPSECVSTIKRLIRQRMRWAEGHSYNTKRMFWKLLKTPQMSLTEKLEFLYLAPYYLQAFFFLVGTLAWLVSETVFQTRLPFWTSLWGWSLVLTNLFALPLVNAVGLFLEESEEKDYMGLLSFVALCYLLVPFQAYAAIKGFLEPKEGTWFRTPKTGIITDVMSRGRFYRWLTDIFRWKPAMPAIVNDKWLMSNAGVVQPAFSPYLSLATANNRFNSFQVRPRHFRWLSRLILVIFLITSVTLLSLTRGVPQALATNPATTQYLNSSTTATLTGAWKLTSSIGSVDSSTIVSIGRNNTGDFQYIPGTTNSTTGTKCSTTPNGSGWILDTPFGGSGGSIASGTWSFYNYEVDNASGAVGHMDVCVYDIAVSGGSITSNNLLYSSQADASWATTDIWDNAASSITRTTGSQASFNIAASHYIYVEYWNHVTTKSGVVSAPSFFYLGTTGYNDPRVVFPTITIPENWMILAASLPVMVLFMMWMRQKKLFAAGF